MLNAIYISLKQIFILITRWMSGIRVVIDQQQLALPLPLADAHSLKVVEQRCQEQIQKFTIRGEIVEWVQHDAKTNQSVPTLTECAKVLNISTKLCNVICSNRVRISNFGNKNSVLNAQSTCYKIQILPSPILLTN